MSGAKSQATAASEAGNSGFSDQDPGKLTQCPDLHWISVALIDWEDNAVTGAPYKMSLTDGASPRGNLTDDLRWDLIPAGLCTFDLTRFWDLLRKDVPGLFGPPPPVPPLVYPTVPPTPPDPDAVRELQSRLTHLGYAPGSIDGLDGPLTQAALGRWRADHGGNPNDGGSDQLDRIQPGFDPDVVQLQNALSAAGYDCGTADGFAGPQTMAALRRWRAAHGVDQRAPVDAARIAAG